MPAVIDVFITGLGPAGARAAATAAQNGCSVLAVDRKQEAGLPVQCAELVPGPIGQITDNIAACRAQPVASMHTYIGDHAASVTAPFPGHIIDRADFDRYHVAQAQAAGADCRFGVSLREFKDHHVELADGQRIEARVVIGADGPRSRIGRAVGRCNQQFVATRQITVPLLQPHDATDIFLHPSIRGGYGWLFPKGDRAHLGLGVELAARDTLPGLLDDLHRDLQTSARVGKTVFATTGGLIPVSGRIDPAVRQGNQLVLLAGDAAGLTNPITGAGIHSALVSGELAGEAAYAWVAGDADAADDYREELETWFGASLDRACRRRGDLAQVERAGRPVRADYEQSWIAYPAYWHDEGAKHPDKTTAGIAA